MRESYIIILYFRCVPLARCDTFKMRLCCVSFTKHIYRSIEISHFLGPTIGITNFSTRIRSVSIFISNSIYFNKTNWFFNQNVFFFIFFSRFMCSFPFCVSFVKYMRHGRGTKCTLPFTTNSHYGPMGMYARSSFSKLFLSFLCFACFLLSINIFFSLCIFRIQIILGSDAVYQSFAEIISDASTDLSIQWIGVSFYYCRYCCCCFSLVVAVFVYRAQFCFVLVHGLFHLLLLLLYFVLYVSILLCTL